jgi:hypothetical protein
MRQTSMINAPVTSQYRFYVLVLSAGSREISDRLVTVSSKKYTFGVLGMTSRDHTIFLYFSIAYMAKIIPKNISTVVTG